jgi:hypothetical protein
MVAPLVVEDPDIAPMDVGVTVVSITQPVLDLYSKLLVVVLNITNPVAGETIASRWVVVIRGGKNPLAVELTSNSAEACAVLPSALIPTDCAVVANVVKIANKIISFFMRVDFVLIVIVLKSIVLVFCFNRVVCFKKTKGKINP